MNSKIKINSKIGWRYIGNEIVAFNCDNQKIVIWNSVASELWQKIYQGVEFNRLIYWLVNNYYINEKQAEQDVVLFLQEALWLGFINCFNFQDNVGKLSEDSGENVLLDIEIKAIKKLIPLDITFETTYACNENCIHCYMDRNLSVLNTVEIKRILDEISQAGCLFLSLTGGEFLMRNDAFEIIEYADKLHFVIDILSNGTFINKDVIDVISKKSVRRVQISLYGSKSETHDFITKLQGSFQKTINGIELLKKAKIKVEIAFPLMRQNFHERYAVKKLADSMNCVISPSPMITARNNGSKDTFSLRLTNKQLNEFLNDKEFASLYTGRKPFKDHQFYSRYSNINDAPPCYSGFNSCAINPLGEVLPCNQLLYKVGNLKQKNFSEIWSGSSELQYLRSLKIGDLKQCCNCDLLDFCSRCPGLALLEGGDLLGLSLENCRIVKMLNNLN